jgi:hypothetical protein
MVPSWFHWIKRRASALKGSSMTAGVPSAAKYLAPSLIAGPGKRWPLRSPGEGNIGRFGDRARGLGPVIPGRLGPGIATLAWSNSVLLMKGALTVSCVGRP